jgi:hypothetical protein
LWFVHSLLLLLWLDLANNTSSAAMSTTTTSSSGSVKRILVTGGNKGIGKGACKTVHGEPRTTPNDHDGTGIVAL